MLVLCVVGVEVGSRGGERNVHVEGGGAGGQEDGGEEEDGGLEMHFCLELDWMALA